MTGARFDQSLPPDDASQRLAQQLLLPLVRSARLLRHQWPQAVSGPDAAPPDEAASPQSARPVASELGSSNVPSSSVVQTLQPDLRARAWEQESPFAPAGSAQPWSAESLLAEEPTRFAPLGRVAFSPLSSLGHATLPSSGGGTLTVAAGTSLAATAWDPQPFEVAEPVQTRDIPMDPQPASTLLQRPDRASELAEPTQSWPPEVERVGLRLAKTVESVWSQLQPAAHPWVAEGGQPPHALPAVPNLHPAASAPAWPNTHPLAHPLAPQATAGLAPAADIDGVHPAAALSPTNAAVVARPSLESAPESKLVAGALPGIRAEPSPRGQDVAAPDALDALAGEAPASVGQQIRNTFNVHVAMSGSGSGLDAAEWERALTQWLHQAARRQGVLS
jgi:hypothetical protein